jgi:mono/diheme cytochrome c family protein
MPSRRATVVFVTVMAVLLVVGGALVAWSGATTVPVDDTEGRRVFLGADCGACHTLRDARTAGRVAPDLDLVRPTTEHVQRYVVEGAPGMPSFADRLSPPEIDAVSRYVAEVAGR